MASYYLSPFVGSGTEEDPFQPDIDAGSWSIIDLRADATQLSGWCVVRAEGVTRVGTDADYLGESTDLGSVLPNPIKNRLKNRLGVDIQQSTLDAILAELLIVWGEDGPGRTRWRPLKANHLGRHRIIMGGEVIYDAPAIQGVTQTETWTGVADGTNINGDLTWTEVDGDWAIVSEAAENASGGSLQISARAEADVASDDHSVDGVLKINSGTSQSIGVAARFDPVAETYYTVYHTHDGGSVRIRKMVNGSGLTTIASGSGSALVTGDVLRLEVDGSNLDAKLNGTSILTGTDTAITGFTRGGITGQTTSANINGVSRYEISDLVATLSASLYATGTSTISSVVDEADTTVDLHLSVDDDPASPNDADWINNSGASGSVFFDLTDLPSDFGTMDTADLIVRDQGANFGTGTVTLYAQLFQSDEATTLSDEIQVAQVTADTSFTNSTVTFTGINTTANKSVWDAAKVRFRWVTS